MGTLFSDSMEAPDLSATPSVSDTKVWMTFSTSFDGFVFANESPTRDTSSSLPTVVAGERNILLVFSVLGPSWAWQTLVSIVREDEVGSSFSVVLAALFVVGAEVAAGVLVGGSSAFVGGTTASMATAEAGLLEIVGSAAFDDFPSFNVAIVAMFAISLSRLDVFGLISSSDRKPISLNFSLICSTATSVCFFRSLVLSIALSSLRDVSGICIERSSCSMDIDEETDDTLSEA
mmetsp:Transcript_13990/g.28665  ORF Transcript_13990/g.28665 Transcript_13990/m.28665 type:complete len:233 (-) Transcript_13990:806-1504(-)